MKILELNQPFIIELTHAINKNHSNPSRNDGLFYFLILSWFVRVDIFQNLRFQ